MENPNSWNSTQKKLHTVLQQTNDGAAIVDALHKEGIIEAVDNDLADVLGETISGWKERLARRMCGVSLPTCVYHKLIELGAIKKE